MQGLLLLCRGGWCLPLWGPGVDPFTSDTHQPQGVLPTQPSEMLPHDHRPPPTHGGAPGPACWGHGRNSTPMVVGPCGVTQDPVVLEGPGGGVLQTHTRNFPMCPGTAHILGGPPSAGAGGAARAPLTGGSRSFKPTLWSAESPSGPFLRKTLDGGSVKRRSPEYPGGFK